MGSGQSRIDEAKIWKMREQYLDMPLEEKRKQYPGYYVTLENIKSWHNYFTDEITDADRHRYTPYKPHDEINSKVMIWHGDITQLEIDAIVNSAARPQQGGQVNRAIIEQTGEWYVQECLINGFGRPGESMLTGGYKLPAKYIINTFAPRNQDQNILRKCYISCLNTAKTCRLKNIAFPCIATGKKRGRFSAQNATELALSTVREWMDENHAAIERVIFCVFDASTQLTYRRFMQKYFPIRGYCSTPTAQESASRSPGQLVSVNEAYEPGNETGLDLEDWRDNKFVPERHDITVTRGSPEKMVKQLLSIYSDSSQLCREPVVQFAGEEGIDYGGLTSEYFFETLDILTHTPIQGSPLFEGPEDHMLPCPAKVHLNLFNITGRLLAHSILHYGIGLTGLSRAIVYLLTRDISRDKLDTCVLPLTMDDVMDMDLRLLLEKKTVDELSTDDKMQLYECMERGEIGYINIEESSFETIKQELLLHEVIYRRWPQIEAIRQGMDEFGLYMFLCLNPSSENVKEVFPKAADLKITPHMLLSKLTLEGPGGDAWEYFKSILDDLSGGAMEDMNLNTLVVFWTGQPSLPSTPLTAEIDPVTTVPQASTCFHRLFIPGACGSYGKFFKAFEMALKFGAKGFGEM